jgi:hypothetical protein
MKIAMYDLEGHLLETFEPETIESLEVKLKTPKNSINGCISGNSNKTGNRQFKQYSKGAKILKRVGDLSNLSETNTPKAISKYYKGKYICTYNSIKEAIEKNKITNSNIVNVLSGYRKTAGGFEWKYAQ